MKKKYFIILILLLLFYSLFIYGYKYLVNFLFTYDTFYLKESIINLSNNVYFIKSYIDINLPIIFGIFLMLIFLMVYALYKLKKEH